MIDILKYALGTFLGAVAAEWVGLRWLKRHRPHLNRNNDIEL